MSNFPPEFRRPVIPNGCRRAPWHDYRSRCIYMITINGAPGLPALSVLQGIPGHRVWTPRAVPTALGEIVATNISRLKVAFPFTRILRRVIMPEHVHFVIFITEDTDVHLGDIIRHLKRTCTLDYRASIGSIPETNLKSDEVSVFDDIYHDRILIKEGQLQSMLNYVSDNPRRRLLRMMNPGYHRKRIVRHDDGREFEIYGNPDLLIDPDLGPVKISSKYTPEQLLAKKRCWKYTVENCGVLVSPFISREEKRVYKWAIENGGRVIVIEDNGFGPRFTPKGIQHELISEGRLLLIAPLHHSLSKKKVTRSECESMNQLATDIAAGRVLLLTLR